MAPHGPGGNPADESLSFDETKSVRQPQSGAGKARNDRPAHWEGSVYRISDKARRELQDPNVGVRGEPTYDGWDWMVDGPMPQDFPTVHRLWRHLMSVEGELEQAAAWRGYIEHMSGVTHSDLHRSSPVTDERWASTMADLYRRETRPERRAVYEQMVQEAAPKPSQAVRDYFRAVHRYWEDHFNWVSPVGMYAEYRSGLMQPPTGIVCTKHVTKPLGGAAFRRVGSLPLDHMDTDPQLVCWMCLEGGKRRG